MVEWAAIRDAVAKHLPDVSPILEYEHRQPGLSFLSDGSSFRFDRGSEQGETLGPIKAVLPLMEARDEAWKQPVVTTDQGQAIPMETGEWEGASPPRTSRPGTGREGASPPGEAGDPEQG